eukprot:TRINITY_DN10796_c0_g1_i1.p1 TRINITY_DN10796_c0_g1~~TRINITY_DN10796_c0_g1_i1.p1  ORF type:complete len:1210 (+),score=190.26 TRINITY_DN10796_c0_g1_i1:452-3631(+)
MRMFGEGYLKRTIQKLQYCFKELSCSLGDSLFDQQQYKIFNYLLSRVKGILQLIIASSELLLQKYLKYHRATCKLGYIVSSICVSLMLEGFCGPVEEGSGEGDGDGDIFKEEEGVGLGEGQGAKDVSDKIQNEDQIQGAHQKDQKQEEDELQDLVDDKSQGVEMEEDFDGQLRDVSKQEDTKSDDGDDMDENEQRLDQQMGDVGDEGDVVDEKLWAEGDENYEDQNQKSQQERYEKDAPIQVEDKTNLEYHAGQEEEAKNNFGDTKPESDDIDEQIDKDQGADEGHEGAVNEEIIEDKQFAKPEAPEQEFALDDEMDFDEGEVPQQHQEDQQESVNVEDMDIDKDREGQDLGQDKLDNQQDPNQLQQDEELETPQQQPNNTEQDHEEQFADENEGNETHLDQDQDPSRNFLEEGQQQIEHNIPQPCENSQHEIVPEQGPRGLAANQFCLEQQHYNQDEPIEEDEQQQNQDDNLDQGETVEAADGMDSGVENQGNAIGKDATTNRIAEFNSFQSSNIEQRRQQAANQSDINPQRGLAEAIKQWKSNLLKKHNVVQEKIGSDRIDNNNSEGEETKTEDNIYNVASEYQYLEEKDQRQRGDDDTIGNATKEQAQQFQAQLNATREDGGNDSDVVMAEQSEEEFDIEMEYHNEEEMKIANTQIGNKDGELKLYNGTADAQVKRDGQMGTEQQSSIDSDNNSQESNEVKNNTDTQQNPVQSYVCCKYTSQDANYQTDLSQQLLISQLSDERRDQIYQQIDEQVHNQQQANEQEISKGRLAWSRYDALTSGLAGELAEQLRLVLEPQMASRLVGDYKSGKKINMKKVIQFIASRFRKDKIWMRRTKPNKRTYQVVLAIDDSKSMTESGCAPYALEALTLICKAMQRLEVGQLGLVSFGGSRGVQLLHSLEQPFTDSVGPVVLGRLNFDQDSTLNKQPMGDLMVTIGHLLEQARHLGSSRQQAPLHQLVLIIADGRLHERDSLRQMVKQMADVEGAMFVYIIVDNPKESVLDIKQVNFLTGGAITTDPYLDSFPFPYYILLRQISALPRTLAELLQQFFQHAMAQQ